MNEPLINEMIENVSDKDDLFDIEKRYFARFQKEIYDVTKFEVLISRLEAYQTKWTECYPRLKAMSDNWGFKLFDDYIIHVNVYSRMGMYDYLSGGVHIGVPYVPWPHKYLDYIFIHELLHIGIEEAVIKRFDLSHEEKERIVDNLCLYVMDGIMEYDHFEKDNRYDKYQLIGEKASYMDKLVGRQPENNLVEAIRIWKEKDSI